MICDIVQKLLSVCVCVCSPFQLLSKQFDLFMRNTEVDADFW